MSIKDTVKDTITICIQLCIGSLFAFLFLFLTAYVLVWVDAAVDTPAVAENNTAVAEDSSAATEYIECGSCGAHVYEYWYVENINDGTPVEVCCYCYENCIENTVAENTATEN